jgi:hypothetical protein
MVITGVSAQSEDQISQYIFPDFVEGKVKLKARNKYDILINYHTVLEQMIYIENGIKLAIGNPQDVDYILIEGRKFIPVGKRFYEEVTGGSIPAYVQYSSKLISLGKPAGYGATSETAAISQRSSISISGQYVQLEVPAGYKVSIKEYYWIKQNDKYHRITSINQIVKFFPEKKDKIKTFAKRNEIKLNTVEEFKRILELCTD